MLELIRLFLYSQSIILFLVECTVAWSRSQFSLCCVSVCVNEMRKDCLLSVQKPLEARQQNQSQSFAAAAQLLLLLLLGWPPMRVCVCPFRSVLGNARANRQRQRQRQHLHTTGKWQCRPQQLSRSWERERQQRVRERARECACESTRRARWLVKVKVFFVD